MRDYSKISPKFWIGATGKKLRAAGMEAQIVSMYLMTCPTSNMLGLFYCPITYIAHETGLGMEGASKGLASSIEAGFCMYDEGTEMVWVMEMAEYQIAPMLKPADKRCDGVQNEYNSLPANPYLARFFDKYSVPFNMTKRRGDSEEMASPLEAPSKPLASQEQEQEQELNPCAPDGDAGSAKPIYPKAFEDFWSMYPRKKSKGDALKAFKKIKPAEYPPIKAGLIAAIDSPEWRKDAGQFIPYPASWLNDRGWEDEHKPTNCSNPFEGAL